MSNNYCLKASGKQIVELARLMDVHSRRTGFDEPILYLGDACRVPDVGAGTYERAFLRQLRS